MWVFATWITSGIASATPIFYGVTGSTLVRFDMGAHTATLVVGLSSGGGPLNVMEDCEFDATGVLGNCTPFGCQTAPRAFIWDPQNGLRDLNVVLPAMGIGLGGWVLSEARGISANGRVIVGTGTNPQGNTEARRVDLGPRPALGDMNCDGLRDGQDAAGFVLALLNPGGYAGAYPNCRLLNGDFDGNGQVTVQDIPGMTACLLNGLCP